MSARDWRAVREGETHTAPKISTNKTPETFIVGVGASGILLAGAAIVFVTLVGLASFNVWPAGHGGGSAGGTSVELANPKAAPSPLKPLQLQPGGHLTVIKPAVPAGARSLPSGKAGHHHGGGAGRGGGNGNGNGRTRDGRGNVTPTAPTGTPQAGTPPASNTPATPTHPSPSAGSGSGNGDVSSQGHGQSHGSDSSGATNTGHGHSHGSESSGATNTGHGHSHGSESSGSADTATSPGSTSSGAASTPGHGHGESHSSHPVHTAHPGRNVQIMHLNVRA